MYAPLVKFSLLRDIIHYSFHGSQLFSWILAILIDESLVLAHELWHRFKCAKLRWEQNDLFLPDFQQWLVRFKLYTVFLEEVVTDADFFSLCLEEGFERVHVQTYACNFVDLTCTPFSHHKLISEELVK